MRRVEMGGQAASRRSKVRVVPVHLQHHHLNLFFIQLLLYIDQHLNPPPHHNHIGDLADKRLKVRV